MWTKKGGVLLIGARSSLSGQVPTVVCLQVSSLCISGWFCVFCFYFYAFFFLIKSSSDSEFWLTFTSFFFFFCFLCPSFTVTHGSVLSNYPWIQWAGMDLHLLVKSQGLIKRDSISAVTFPWCYSCSLLYPHCEPDFTMYWWLLLLLNNVKWVLTSFWTLQL